MVLDEIFIQLGHWIKNCFFQPLILPLFLSYFHVCGSGSVFGMRIRIPKVPENGSNLDQDPQHWLSAFCTRYFFCLGVSEKDGTRMSPRVAAAPALHKQRSTGKRPDGQDSKIFFSVGNWNSFELLLSLTFMFWLIVLAALKGGTHWRRGLSCSVGQDWLVFWLSHWCVYV